MSEVIATPSKTAEILRRYDLRAQKRFGQNFLIDPNIVRKIAEAACEKDLPVLEVGPGIGSLTQQLCLYAKEVYTYEIDKKLIPVLQQELGEYEDLTITEGDFLEVDLDSVPFKEEEITFCSNLPYYVTTPILFKLIESPLKIRRMTVMVQKEVAERFRAQPCDPEYGALSVILAYRYEVKNLLNVGKGAFSPQPKVDSTVVTFTPKGEGDPAFEKSFYPFVQKCFAQRRKTLYNNLRQIPEVADPAGLLQKLGFKENVRAQELNVQDFIRLHQEVYEGKSVREDQSGPER